MFRRMRWTIIMNDAAGTIAKLGGDAVVSKLKEQLAHHGIEADLQPVPAKELTASAKRAATSGCDAVLAAGGDGTLNAVAIGLLDTGVPFGVIPLGTHNHFAKDLGIPLELADAIAALSTGQSTDLPVGDVNGNLFLNFSAIGMHPRIVKHRDAQRETLDRGKWPAMFIAMWRAMVRFPIIRVVLTAGDARRVRRTPSVIVCNNAHQMEVFGVENASFPDRRVLNTYVAKPRGRMGMIWLMIKAMFGALEPAKNFEVIAGPRMQIETRRSTVHVSIDGEIIDLQSPLVYTVRERSLKVIVPRKST